MRRCPEGPSQVRLVQGAASCLCTFYDNGKANVMVIDSVYTEPAYRRQGHARKLLKGAIALAREWGVDSVELQVGKDNEAAQALYSSLGLEPAPKDLYRLILRHWDVTGKVPHG